MPDFAFDGEFVRYLQRGTGARPVIFLHNLGSSSLIWEPLMASLGDEFTAYAIDFPGYGNSELNSARSIDWYVDLIRAFAEERQLAEITFVGNCVGSAVSILFASQHPGLVRAMVLFNPATAATLSPTPLGLLTKLGALGVFPERLLRSLRLPRWAAKAMLWFQTGSGTVSPRCEGLRGQLEGLWRDTGRLRPLALVAPTVKESLTRIDELPRGAFEAIGVRMIWGENNRVLSAKAGRALAAKLGVEYVGIPGAGHLPMLERPEHAAGLVHEMLIGKREVGADR